MKNTKSLKYHMTFLLWVNRCLFPDDFCKELFKLGVNKKIAWSLASYLKHSEKRNLLDLFQACGNGNDKDEYSKALYLYLKHMEKIYKNIHIYP